MEERILAAASALFFQQGFGRTTLDQVAEAAHAGKTTLYGRFPTKEALFAAIVQRYAADLNIRMTAIQVHGPLKDRLVRTGEALAKMTLTPDSIALMRFTLAEAPIFPELAREGFRIGFEGCVQCFSRCIAGSSCSDAVDAARPAAARFHEMALHPLYFHAFFGADLEELYTHAIRNIPQVVDGLIATGHLRE